jgi:hypothetical protein
MRDENGSSRAKRFNNFSEKQEISLAAVFERESEEETEPNTTK